MNMRETVGNGYFEFRDADDANDADDEGGGYGNLHAPMA